MGKYHIHIPELSPSMDDVKSLLGTFEQNREHEYHFVPPADKGVDLGLHMLVKYKRTSLIHALESKIRFVKQSYFLRNNGVDIHRDIKRTAVIGIELSNPLNAPTKMYDDDRSLAEEVFYDGVNAALWDTTRLHSVDNVPIERIYFQMELERHLSFQDYVELYQSGELFRW